MKYRILLIIFMFWGLSPAYAASLADLKEMALENRQLVKKYEARLSQAEKEVGIARSAYLPALDAAYTVNQLGKASVFEPRETSIVNTALTWNLFAGFKDKYGVKSARLQRQAAVYKLAGIRQDVRLNVALSYLVIYDRKARLTVEEDSYHTLQNVYKDAENRFAVGLINKNELLKIKVDLDNSQIAGKKAQAALDKSVLALQREINAKVGMAELEFAEFDTLPQLANEDEYEAKMRRERSEIKALEELLAAAEAGVDGQRASLYPRLDLSSSYLKYDDGFVIGQGASFSGLGNSEEIRHQLTLSINLFDGFKKYNSIKKAKEAECELRNDLNELVLGFVTDLKNLFLDYDVSFSTVKVAETSIFQAEENLRITRLSYKEGLSTMSELLDAVTNLSRARYNYVLAKSELFSNYFRLARMVNGG